MNQNTINILGAYLLYFDTIPIFKLLGYINWPWIWVFLPIWGPVVILATLLSIFIISQKGKGYD